jgi:hypothetical protein
MLAMARVPPGVQDGTVLGQLAVKSGDLGVELVLRRVGIGPSVLWRLPAAYAGPLGQRRTADQHPVVILAGADLVDLLREKGCSTPGAITRWLREAFPVG